MTHSEFTHLLNSLNSLSPEQIRQLRRALDRKLAAPTATSESEPTDEQLQSRLFEVGLLSEIRPPVRVATGTERFTPVPIEGEPLSETILRERR